VLLKLILVLAVIEMAVELSSAVEYQMVFRFPNMGGCNL